MKATKGNILIKADLEQKETLTFGSLKLYIPNKAGMTENMREGNPTVCEVIDGEEFGLHKGELLLLNHNTLINIGLVIVKDGSNVIMSIPNDRYIIAKLDEDGNVIPLNDNYVTQRIPKEQVISDFIIIPEIEKTNLDNVGVIKVCPFNADLSVSDKIVYYTYSDYELVYSINGVEKRVVTVHRSDIVAKFQ